MSNVRVSIDPNNIPVVEKKHFSLIVYADGVKRIIRNDTGKTVAFFADGKWEHPVSDYYSFGSEAVSELLDMLKNGDFDD